MFTSYEFRRVTLKVTPRPRWSAIFVVLLVPIVFTATMANAQASNPPTLDFTVIQTADIHSHFTNRESALHRGGLARVFYEINQIRKNNQNTITLDAGDWTEGNMFFTLDSGETSQKLLETINYDAVVLGNHDWLIGPQEMFNAFEGAQFRIPVLSANIDTSALSPAINLGKYITPHIIKEIGGVKIGIFGVSTFQLIYDSFFKPVKLIEPLQIAAQEVDTLRNKEHCQIVIMLSHLGIDTDKVVGALVPGIDYIVGGHTHILLTTPAYGGKTPITHVGCWGQYVGETHLHFDGTKTSIVSYQAHPIEESMPEDPIMKTLVDGAIAGMQNKFGGVYSDNVLSSDVDLPAQRTTGENLLGNWAVDAIRDAGQTDVAIDTPYFASRDLFAGESSTADFFNAFPHIFNPVTQKAWTVKTFELNGLVLKLLTEFVETLGFPLEVSNGKIAMDKVAGVDKVNSFAIGGKAIDDLKTYRVSATDGIWAAIQLLENNGIDLGATNFHDTGLEAWRFILNEVRMRSPITRDKVTWEGRVRSSQADLDMRLEDIQTQTLPGQKVEFKVLVRNAGLQNAASSTITVATTENTPETPNSPVKSASAVIPALAPASTSLVQLLMDISGRPSGMTPIHFHIDPVAGEVQTSNNDLDSALAIP